MRPMKSLKERDPVRMGLVGAVIFGLIGLGIAAMQLLPIGDNTYTAEFAQAGGLRPGDEVRVAGVPVGTVKGIELAGTKVEVKMWIQDDVRLGKDTTASIKVATLLGRRLLDVDPEGPGEIGDRIPLAQTSVPFLIQDVLEKGAPAIEALDLAQVRTALNTLSDNFRDTPDEVRQTLDGLSRLSAVIATRQDQVNQLLASGNRVTTALNGQKDDLIGLMADSQIILAEVRKRRAVIHQLLVDSERLSRELVKLVGKNQTQIEPLLRNIETVARVLKENDASLERMLVLFAPTARYFANTGGDGPWVNAYAPDLAAPDTILCLLKGGCG